MDRNTDLQIDPAAYQAPSGESEASRQAQTEATNFHLKEEGKKMQISPEYLQQGQQTAAEDLAKAKKK